MAVVIMVRSWMQASLQEVLTGAEGLKTKEEVKLFGSTAGTYGKHCLHWNDHA